MPGRFQREWQSVRHSIWDVHLGYFYWYRGDNDKGLETLEAARIAFEPIDRPVDVASASTSPLDVMLVKTDTQSLGHN